MDQFLGVVGHELRTPLAGVRAMSEFLLSVGSSGAAEFEDFLRHIHDEALRMSDTVENLLEAARLNSGRSRWNWSRFWIQPICEQAVESIRPLVDERRTSLTCAVAPSPVAMNGDADAVRRLVLNLLNNARKHTPAGGIRVSIHSERVENGNYVSITVRDTGAGIDPAIAHLLGEAFSLNSGFVGQDRVDGTGVGLAICKSIAAAHGGELRIVSEPGTGTSVTARLRADLAGPIESPGRIDFLQSSLPSEGE